MRITHLQWLKFALLQKCAAWCKNMRARLGAAHERSSWWLFVWSFRKEKLTWIRAFIAGKHQFSPLRQYLSKNNKSKKGDVVEVWEYLDRLMIHLILGIITPTFKRVISKLCCYLSGPSTIKCVTADIMAALKSGRFNYCLRLDIKRYYATINHKILLKQLHENYADPILLRYFTDIVTIGVDCGGQVVLPKTGIPIRSALSPFFGAIYLTPLDKAFARRPTVFYRRYMDGTPTQAWNKWGESPLTSIVYSEA